MNSKILYQNLIRFIVLILAQIFIFNKINLGGWLNPMVYPLYILLLPFETNKNLSLLLAFIMGIIIDLFTASIGLHTSALVFMAYMRPVSFRLINSSKNYEAGIMPGINDLGYIWFITYTFFLIFSHHLFFFFVEAFSFDEFGYTLLRVLLNTLVSSLLIIIIDILFKPIKRNR